MKRPRGRWVVGLLVAGLLVGQALLARGVNHGSPHAGGDNAGYVALGLSLLSGQGYTELWDPARPPHSKYPPVFPALVATRIALGGSTWTDLKQVTGVFGLLSVLAAFLFASARAGPAVGLGVGLLTALSASSLDYGRWVLSDVPFLALTLLALWAAERAQRRGESGAVAAGRGTAMPWLLALGLAALAAFTRSAGLPLVVAVLIGVALVRRWRLLALAGGGVMAALAAWALRARTSLPGTGAYVSEFWLVNPYEPELGRIGLFGLVARIADNAVGYLTLHLPAGLTGATTGTPRAAAVAVVVLGLAGWALAVRRRIGVVELFVPAYLLLVLAWPQVWSGDRFAMPLIPVLLLYAAEAAGAAIQRPKPSSRPALLVAAAAVVGFFQLGSYGAMASEAAACRGAVRAAGPYACHGPEVVQFVEAARWAGVNLPGEAAVLTRKPRIWYLMSGLPSRTYPFNPEPEVLLSAAGEAKARYLVLDFIGVQGLRYLRPAIAGSPTSFCGVAGFGREGGLPGTELLGILSGAVRAPGPPSADGTVRLGVCPPGMAGTDLPVAPYSSSSSIPILSPSLP